MRAGLGVDAGVGQSEPLDGAAGNQMLANDFGGVFGLNVAVPDGFRIDHDGGTMLALVEAAGLVDAYRAVEPGSFQVHLELRKKVAFTVLGAGRARRAFRADVMTDKYMAFKGCQTGISSSSHGTAQAPPLSREVANRTDCTGHAARICDN
jgi:hypothetical protein